MYPGIAFIFIFQSLLLTIVQIVVFHIILHVEIKPKSIFYITFGLIILELANFVELSLFNEYIVSQIGLLMFWGPILEELLKVVILIYISVQTDGDPLEIMFAGLMTGFGFGIGESLGYGLIYGFNVMMIRSVVLSFAHPLFGLVIGTGMVIFERKQQYYELKCLGLISLSILLHILWNFVGYIEYRLIVFNVIVHFFIYWFIVSNIYYPTKTTVSSES